MKSSKTFQTKEQMLHRIQEGLSFDDGEEYCASDYLRMAQERTKKWIYKNSTPKGMDDSKLRMAPKELEKSYWDAVEVNKKDHVVEYGNDVDTDKFGSGFPRSERGRCVGADVDKEKEGLPEPKFGTDEFYKESYWNLQNIPNCPDSILQHIKVGINGINVPWLYFGDLFTTFCWHNEDNYLYSINYNHWGLRSSGMVSLAQKKTQEDWKKCSRIFYRHGYMKNLTCYTTLLQCSAQGFYSLQTYQFTH